MAEAVLKINTQTQICKCCGKEKDVSEFRQTKLGLMRTCNECIRKNQIAAKLDKKLAKHREDEVEKAKAMRLDAFTPRELMKELKRRGYEFTMKYTEDHVIDSKSL